jgi:ethanolamine ammonia-lyase small subunit
MARDRQEYLQRPDLGRKLDEASREQVASLASGKHDVVFILADGLSAEAINLHAIHLLQHVIPSIEKSFRIAPFTLVQHGRVAISDDIGELLQARLAVILIGERPGLSSPDSLGIYLTYDAHPGKTDESRNCISNVRPGGLSYEAAAKKLLYFIDELMRLKLSGVAVKDRSENLKE